jgi:chromate reductase, NAD(P)H dehydrogenase (quinone)
MRLLGLSGSLRKGSYNTALLEAAAAQRPRDVEFVAWHGLADLPAFDENLVQAPRAVQQLIAAIAHSDAVLIATPEYNGSVPGGLKNALDWASRPFDSNVLRNKPAAVIGASPGPFGAVWAQADLRRILRTIGADVKDCEFVLPRAHEAFTADGRLRDANLEATLRAVVADLARGTLREAA